MPAGGRQSVNAATRAMLRGASGMSMAMLLHCQGGVCGGCERQVRSGV